MINYRQILRRGALITAATTAVMVVIAVAISSTQQRLYQSYAEVFLSGAQTLPANVATQIATDPARYAKTQEALARTPSVAQLALNRAGIRGTTPAQLLAQTTVDNPTQTDILTFTATDSSPVQSQRVATGYAQAFTDYRKRLDTGAIVDAAKQLELRLTALERAHQVRTGLYRSLAVNDEQLRTSEALQSSNVAFVRPGSKGTQIQPQTGRNAVFGGILGLIIGLGLTYLLGALDTRLRSSEEAQHRLGLPLLARIPELPSALAKGKLAMVENPRAPETEPFKMLATNLGLVNLDRGAKSIMITSAARGEGKSTTLANMAIALARAGMRVKLVDLDLKRPGLSGLFGITSDKPGITSVAAGMATLESALTEIPLDHGEHTGSEGFAGAFPGSLDLLATGPVPPDTANFVSSARLAELLARLAERSDLVLIDAPPILQISDAMALTSKVDALMVVVRLSVIRRPAIKELRRVLEAAPVAKLGCVLIEVRGEAGYYGAYTDYAAPVQSSNGARRWRVGAKTG